MTIYNKIHSQTYAAGVIGCKYKYAKEEEKLTRRQEIVYTGHAVHSIATEIITRAANRAGSILYPLLKETGAAKYVSAARASIDKISKLIVRKRD